MGRNRPPAAKPEKRHTYRSGDPRSEGRQGSLVQPAYPEIIWAPQALADYRWWQRESPPVVERIKALIADILRLPFKGLGKPESLRHNWSGYWSRRITGEHRLVYKVVKGEILVVQCRYHY